VAGVIGGDRAALWVGVGSARRTGSISPVQAGLAVYSPPYRDFVAQDEELDPQSAEEPVEDQIEQA
jgi:hypothetical protein